MVISLFVVLSRGLTLVNDGLYWDDWVYSRADDASIWREFVELGGPFGALFHLALDRPLAYQAVKFTAFFLTAHLVFSVLQAIARHGRTAWGSSLSLLLTCVFVLFPSNSAQVSLIVVPYFGALCLFWLAFWLILHRPDAPRPLHQALALAAFFVSFQTESLLVLYAVPLAVLIFVCRQESLPATARLFVRRYWAFLLLPFVYWLLKLTVFGPSGRLAGYNALKWDVLPNVPTYTWNAFTTSVREAAAIFRKENIGALAIASTIAFAAIYRLLPARLTTRQALSGMAIGAVLFVLCVFPYIMAGYGHIFALDDMEWYTRNELLIPIAAAVLVVVGFGAPLSVRSALPQALVFAVLLGGFLLAHVQLCLQFQRDWFKQVAVIEQLRANPEFARHDSFVFIDSALSLNAIGRRYRDYELAALFQVALNDQRTRTFKMMSWDDYLSHIKHATPDAAKPLLRIEVGPRPIDLPETAALTIRRYVDPAAFTTRVRDAIAVTAAERGAAGLAAPATD